ncbi:MAG: thioredoxin family protein [Pseudomonadota bacterium]
MITRRTLVLSSLAAATLPALPALAKPLDYTPGMVAERLAAGDTVFLDFKASWCSTCRAQERTLTALKKDNAAYEQKITFINVDWDDFGGSDLVKRLNIPRRSTLVVLKGNKELGRIVADTSKSNIKALMDVALQA